MQQHQQQQDQVVEDFPSHQEGPQPTVLTLEPGQDSVNRLFYTTARTNSMPSEQSTDQQQNSDRKAAFLLFRRHHWILLFSILFLSVTALVLSLTVSGGKKNSGSTLLEGSETSNDFYRDRFMVLRRALGNFSKPYLFYNPDSAQSKALQWLVFRDQTLPSPDAPDFEMRLAQRYAYLVLYHACGGVDWHNLAPLESQMVESNTNDEELMYSQVVHSHECEFWGVTCNEEGQVTQVQLHSEGLVGPLPQEVGLWKNIRALNLKDNSLRGNIDFRSLGRLSHLEWLDLGMNQFWGTLNTELGSLTNLKSLFLDNNRLTGELPSTALMNLLQLEELVVTQNYDLSGKLMEIAAAAPWLNLTFISSSDTKVSGTIPNDVDKFVGLQHLGLGDTMISGTLPSVLTKLTNLKSLNLLSSHLTNTTFPTDIEKLSKLTMLSLMGHGIHGTIPTGIGHLTDLKHLLIPYTSMTGPIPTEIGLLTKLLSIDAQNTGIGGTIPSEIEKLTELGDLKLWSTNVEGYVPDSLCQRGTIIAYPCRVTCNCCNYDCKQKPKSSTP